MVQKQEGSDFTTDSKATRRRSAATAKSKKSKTVRKAGASKISKKSKKPAKPAGKRVKKKSSSIKKKSGSALSLKAIGHATGKTVGRLTRAADNAAKALKGAASKALSRKRSSK